MNPPARRTPQPPQPVEPENPTWRVMFFQWLIDRVTHLDECMDETKDSVKEQHIELSAWMQASKESDANIMERVAKHISEHDVIDQTQAAKRSVWKMQGGFLRDLLKFATEGTVIAGLLAMLKYAGII